MPNFAFNLLARTPLPSLSPRFFESIRLLVNSGEPLRSASIEAFLAAFEPRGLRRSAMQTSYGMAENTFAVTQSLLGEGPITLRVDRDALLVGGRVVVAPDAAERSLVLVSSGRVLPAHRIRIANASNYGQVGEIEIKSGCLFSGYLADPAATKTAFTEDGWYRTGDLGFSWGGHLFVTGRKSDLVIVNGVNIYPSDVEDIAGAVAGVKPGRIVAFGVESAYSGSEQLVVLAEPTEDGLMDVVAQRIREEVYAVLSVVVHDVEIVPRGTLAKSTSGKLSRAANRTFYLNARAGADAAAAAAARGRR
jgi:acyl-CoA synthetase (AMP-forming)/AMP-acid ligase II